MNKFNISFNDDPTILAEALWSPPNPNEQTDNEDPFGVRPHHWLSTMYNSLLLFTLTNMDIA